jgi:hypothetical protein
MKNSLHFFTILLLFLGSHVFCQVNTVSAGIAVPDGYERIEYPEGSFSSWLQNLPLKSSTEIVKYDGGKVWGALYRVWAVVDKPLLFQQDLEQCADYCMRFWADYHKESGLLNRLYLFDYNGNRKMYAKSQKSYRSFLKWAMAYSNSHSLKKGCRKVNPDSLQPGDMFVQNQTGGIGHASLIVDVCRNQDGKKLYLVGYSYMPAQEFHIEKAKSKYGQDGWFSLEGFFKYLEHHPLGRYGEPVFRRFEQL